MNLFSPRISISGGIGNQLFQWAAAHIFFGGSRFKFDLGHYRINKEREFQLSPIIKYCSHTIQDADESQKPSAVRYFEWAAHKGFPTEVLASLGYFQENAKIPDFRLRVEKRVSLGLPVIINGLFQNGDMVNHSFEYIGSELDIAMKESLQVLPDSISVPTEYIALHVRRGDYPMSSMPSAAIGQLDDDFFMRLLPDLDLPILLLTENSNEVVDLARRINPYKVITSTEASPLQTLALMANSQFFIGSNSSLSWWGAYLLAKQGKSQWLPDEWSQWGNYENLELKIKILNFSPSIWKAA